MSRTRMISRCVLATLLCAGSVGAAEADKVQQSGNGAARADAWLIAKYDTDGDHVISLEEVSKKRERMFGHMDIDQDGTVSFDEYQMLDANKRAELLKARFAKLDINRDGDLSAEEYSSYLGSFDRIDKDGDGRVTQKEMAPSKASAKKADGDVITEENAHCVWRICFKSSSN